MRVENTGLEQLVVGNVGEHVVFLYEVVRQVLLSQAALQSPPHIQELLPDILLCPVPRASLYQSERKQLFNAG